MDFEGKGKCGWKHSYVYKEMLYEPKFVSKGEVTLILTNSWLALAWRDGANHCTQKPPKTRDQGLGFHMFGGKVHFVHIWTRARLGYTHGSSISWHILHGSGVTNKIASGLIDTVGPTVIFSWGEWEETHKHCRNIDTIQMHVNAKRLWKAWMWHTNYAGFMDVMFQPTYDGTCCFIHF